MFTIYLVELPWTYSPRIFAFSSEDDAKKLCAVFRSGASKKIIDYQELKVYEPIDLRETSPG